MNIKSYLKGTSGRIFLVSLGLYLAGTGAMAINGPVDSSWTIYSLIFALVIVGAIYSLGQTLNGSGLSAAGLVLVGPVVAPGFVVITYNSTSFGAGPGYALVALGALCALSGILKVGGSTSEPTPATATEAS